MAKLFKLTAYLVDPVDEFDTDSLEDCIIYCTQNDLNLRHTGIESVDIGEWDDDHPLNYIDCPKAEFEKYFNEAQLEIESPVPAPKVMHNQITAEIHQKLIDQLGIKFKKEN